MKSLKGVLILSIIANFIVGCGILPIDSTSPADGQQDEPLLSRLSVESTESSLATPLPTAQVIVIETSEPNPIDSAAPTSAPTDSPGPATLRKLTSGGCCVDPFWSADSQQVFFIDRPHPEALSGVWGVDLLGSEPIFVTDRLGIYSNDQLMRAFPLSGKTFVEDLINDQLWEIPNGGREIVFSADDTQVAWTTGRTQPPFDTAERQVWVSNVDGTAPRQVFSGYGVGVNTWFPQGFLLVSGRQPPPESLQAYWMLTPPADGVGDWQAVELTRGRRLRGAALSPNGEWLAYVAAFSGDPAQDGLWLVETASLQRRKLNLFGAYRWRDSDRLLVIPLDLTQPQHHVLLVEAATGLVNQVTFPGTTPFKIANGDWSVSPDGKHIVFVSALDGNLWLISLDG